MMLPEIGEGLLMVALIHVQMVFEFPQAFPGKTQMLQPEPFAAGNAE